MAVKVQLKGLNGIRAIAAMAVVIFHTGAEFKSFVFESTIHTSLGGFGVSMFFTVSGFLITYLLLFEKEQFCSVRIKYFYDQVKIYLGEKLGYRNQDGKKGYQHRTPYTTD